MMAFATVKIAVVLAVIHVSLMPLQKSDFGMLEPCLVSDFEVHLRHERIDSIFFANNVSVKLIIRHRFGGLWRFLLRHQVYFILCFELEDLHFSIDLHAAILSPHASVQQLVEVNEAKIWLDAHFQENLFDLAVAVELSREAEAWLLRAIFAQLSK